jgi:predicted methyltransferase
MEEERNHAHEMYGTPVVDTVGKEKEPPNTNHEQFESAENRSDHMPFGRLRYLEESMQPGRSYENTTAGESIPSARVNMESESAGFMPSGRLRE